MELALVAGFPSVTTKHFDFSGLQQNHHDFERAKV
jgi:hypothetical protein